MNSKLPLIRKLLPIVHFEVVQVAHLRGHAQVAKYLRKLTTTELLLKQQFVPIVMPSIQIDSNRSSPFDDHQNETTRINGDGAQTFSYGDGHESIIQEDHRCDPFNLIDLNMNMHLPQQPEIASIRQEIIGKPCNATLNLNIVDTLVPDSLVLGYDHNINSMHEMWKGRKFSNRDSFREALAKATMYNKFAMKRLRTSPTEVMER
ncbi:hypothetical protein AAC387_Pa05g1485 [Persea americana]